MRLFDSHAHLTDESFATDLEDVVSRAADAGVEAIVSVASNVEDARSAIDLTRRTVRPRLLATAGVHPHEASRFSAETLSELETLAGSGSVAAIGEIGLDFHHENAPRRAQIAAFRSQIELAEKTGLPVVVHARDADQELASIIHDYSGRAAGVLHCFVGGPELLEAGLRAGWYVSFSGIVTFKNFRDVSAVRRVPEDRILVETDSPYLAPAARRGRRNEPALVQHVVERVAELRGEDPDRIAELTYGNACRFYGLGS